MKVKAKDIKYGDLVLDYGLILSVDLEGTSKFWCGKGNVDYICIHDAYHGECSSSIDPDKEYELIEGKEKRNWLAIAKGEILEHIDDMRTDLENVREITIKEIRMEQTINEVEEVKYVVKVNGAIVSPMYATPHLAEDAIKLLKDEHQSIAEVVSVTGAGQEILLG